MVTSLLPHCFSVELLAVLCAFTNVFLKKNFTFEVSYSASWGPITIEEFCDYIALLFYMSIVTDPNIRAYWSKSSLYCGLWGKHIMSQIYKQMRPDFFYFVVYGFFQPKMSWLGSQKN